MGPDIEEDKRDGYFYTFLRKTWNPLLIETRRARALTAPTLLENISYFQNTLRAFTFSLFPSRA
jgi:hypothetical protein